MHWKKKKNAPASAFCIEKKKKNFEKKISKGKCTGKKKKKKF